MTWHSVEAAIADAYAGEVLRAIDPEAMANRTTRDRPNPGKKPTVRRTGSEGSYQIRQPTTAVERARVRAIVEELPELTRILVVGWALGYSQNALVESMRKRWGDRTAAAILPAARGKKGSKNGVRNGDIRAIREAGMARVGERLRMAELVAA